MIKLRDEVEEALLEVSRWIRRYGDWDDVTKEEEADADRQVALLRAECEKVAGLEVRIARQREGEVDVDEVHAVIEQMLVKEAMGNGDTRVHAEASSTAHMAIARLASLARQGVARGEAPMEGVLAAALKQAAHAVGGNEEGDWYAAARWILAQPWVVRKA